MPKSIPHNLAQYSVLFIVKSEVFGDSRELLNILDAVDHIDRLETLGLEGAIETYSTHLVDSDVDTVSFVVNSDIYEIIDGATNVA